MMRGTLRAALVAASFYNSVIAEAVNSEQLDLTEAELRAYDGSDTSKPIYLAIDGTIFDVSVAPAFYGPGGHYNHFAGRDATRAWVTECWDTEDQLTWRMDGIEEMFMPKYLDELISSYTGENAGTELDEFVGVMGKEAVLGMAEKAAERFGKITEADKKKRRDEDLPEAQQKVKDGLAHWYNFFSGNPKYTIVGKVIRDEKGTPAPPSICEAAMKKRPVKGGKMEGLMNLGMGGAKDTAGKPGKPSGQKKAKKDKKDKKDKKPKAGKKEKKKAAKEDL